MVRLDPDPAAGLSPDEAARGRAALQLRGCAVRGRPSGGLEVVIDAEDAEDARRRAAEACAQAFGGSAVVSSVTFVSRGTDADALGVVTAFGLDARLERVVEDGEDVVVVGLAPADRGRVPESRLSTALEAALNCAVRLEFE